MRKLDLSTSLVWNRIVRLFTGGIRQRITRLGVVYSFATAVVAAAAFISGNNLVFLVLAVMLSTFIVSGLVSRLGLDRLELEFFLPEHVSARRRVPGRVQVQNRKRWLPSFSIHLAGTDTNVFPTILYFPVIPTQTLIEEPIVAQFPRRGSYRDNAFQFVTRFPFGFTERRIKVVLRGEVVVYPSIDPREEISALLERMEGELEAKLRGRGDDFYRIRPYEYGESARHVDWKATAHTGALQVREFARERDPKVEIYLDLERADGSTDGSFEEWFEEAIEACAFLVWNLASKGARVRFRTQTTDLSIPEEADAYTILKFLALVEPLAASRAMGLGENSEHDSIDLHVLFSARPERFEAAGWQLGHVVDTRRLPVKRAAAAGSASGDAKNRDRAGAHADHGSRKRQSGSAGVDGDSGRAGTAADSRS